MTTLNSTAPRQQQGIALVLVLVLLVVTTMIGTTALRTARIQEQLAGATHDRAVARAAGDASMVDAHLYVYRSDFEPITAPLAPVTSVNDGWTLETWRKLDFDWTGAAVQQFGAGRIGAAPLRGVAANPTYAVEMLPAEIVQTGHKEDALRVTVRATGARVTTEHYSMAIILLPK